MRFFPPYNRSMAKKNNLRRTRKQYGGGYGFSGASIPGVSNYGQVITPIGDCRAEPPPGFIANTFSQKGLPGLAGGARRSMKGGRYGFDLTNPVPGAAAPWAGGIPPVQRIPCEASVSNPLNAGPSLLKGGRRKSRKQYGGAGLGSDTLAYYAPTAGYENLASRFTDSVGAPILLQKPYDAQSWNPACIKTGGKRRKSKNSRKNSRKSHRKNTRRTTRK